MRPESPDAPSAPPPLHVEGDGGTWTFDRAFTVGRDAACDVVVDSARATRRHAELVPVPGGWQLRDLGSSNGTFLDGARVETAHVPDAADLQLGAGGPHLRLRLGDATPGTRPTPTAGSASGHTPEPVDPFRPTPDELARHEATSPTTSPFPLGEGEGSDAADERRTARSISPAPTPTAGPIASARAERRLESRLRGNDGTGERESTADARSAPDPTASSADGSSGDAGGDSVDSLSYDAVVERYFGDGADEAEMGERTRFIRQAYDDIQRAQTQETERQHSRYRLLVGAAVLVSVIALAYAGYQEVRVRSLLANAEEIFYELRSVEVDLAQREIAIAQQIEARPELADSLTVDLERSRATRRRIAARYDKYVSDAGFYDGLSSEEEELIYRTARAFGESELTIPPAFVDEVKVQIRYWTRGRRFVEGVRRAQVEGHDVAAVRALQRHGMPTEFFYLALQESDFKTDAVGPWTRYGHAKGAWQFIPETGKRYGLTPGPLVDTKKYDPLDERHDFDQAADAAARYMRDIYVHLAQASGLLVCASYNWGEGRVRKNMRQIERELSGIDNSPEARTYWKFLTTYRDRMPSETKDYVMKIFAAAVIGQNPRAFGIDLDPPIATALRGGRGGIRTDDAPAGARTTRLGGRALEARQLDAASD